MPKKKRSHRSIQQEIKEDATKVIQQISENYIHLEKSITSQLNMAAERHHVTSGTFREDIWKSLFEQIIPRKFSIEQSVFLIDSHGHVSKEVDLAIFDEQYTPYIFRHGRIKYIPIEAVAVVVQCKSKNVKGKDMKVLTDWSRSITKLNTSLRSITRMFNGIAMGEYSYESDKGKLLLPMTKEENGNEPKPDVRKKLTQTSTRPIQILCHTLSKCSTPYIEPFDINIHPEGDRLKVRLSSRLQDLASWSDALNHKENVNYDDIKAKFKAENPSSELGKALLMENYRVYEDQVKQQEIALLSLTFQLNQLLMLINNPILFPHMAYVNMFNNNGK
ncbi:hypothetical protein C1I60_11370 [Paenibacillus terrae]|uniref:DUF6602 domain-containing protein n=1 Tax=Paenibacillus terrae TaxID=159743 RepID=A0A4U2PZ20_9BACL|nr:DUF6602 domain-containing protein [Paenibacillus terrae]TKH43950.1 hypothetical protein C1I60_11370 [Paenibacillus terrae]